MCQRNFDFLAISKLELFRKLEFVDDGGHNTASQCPETPRLQLTMSSLPPLPSLDTDASEPLCLKDASLQDIPTVAEIAEQLAADADQADDFDSEPPTKKARSDGPDRGIDTDSPAADSDSTGDDDYDETQQLDDYDSAGDDDETQRPNDEDDDEDGDEDGHPPPDGDAVGDADGDADGGCEAPPPPPKRPRDETPESDDEPCVKKQRKQRTTHPRLVAAMCAEATEYGVDVTEMMAEAEKWIGKSKAFKGADYCEANDGVMIQMQNANGEPMDTTFLLETPNPTINKAQAKAHFAEGNDAVDSDDDDAEPEPDQPQQRSKPGMVQRACTTGSITVGGAAKITGPTMMTGGRAFQVATKDFNGLFVSECSVMVKEGDVISTRDKTTLFETKAQTAEEFHTALGDVGQQLCNNLSDGQTIKFCIGAHAHSELKALVHTLQDRLAAHGRDVVAKEHQDLVARVTRSSLVDALTADPTMVPKMLPTVMAFMLVGPDYARVMPEVYTADEIEWGDSPDEAFAADKCMEAIESIKRPVQSANGAHATWDAISDRAPNAATLADCFPPGAIAESIHIIQQVAQKLYAIIWAGSFRQTMLECQSRLRALEGGAAEPTDEVATEDVKADTGVDLIQMIEEWIDGHQDEAADAVAIALKPVTHTKSGDPLGSKMLKRLATGDLTHQLQTRKDAPERMAVADLVHLAIGDECERGITDGEMEEDVLASTTMAVAELVGSNEPTGVGAAIGLLINTYYVKTYEEAEREREARIKAAEETRSGRRSKPNGWREMDAQ